MNKKGNSGIREGEIKERRKEGKGLRKGEERE